MKTSILYKFRKYEDIFIDLDNIYYFMKQYKFMNKIPTSILPIFNKITLVSILHNREKLYTILV